MSPQASSPVTTPVTTPTTSASPPLLHGLLGATLLAKGRLAEHSLVDRLVPELRG